MLTPSDLRERLDVLEDGGDDLCRRTAVSKDNDVLVLERHRRVPLCRVHHDAVELRRVERRICRDRESAHRRDEDVARLCPLFARLDVLELDSPQAGRAGEASFLDEGVQDDAVADAELVHYTIVVAADSGGARPLRVELGGGREGEGIEGDRNLREGASCESQVDGRRKAVDARRKRLQGSDSPPKCHPTRRLFRCKEGVSTARCQRKRKKRTRRRRPSA